MDFEQAVSQAAHKAMLVSLEQQLVGIPAKQLINQKRNAKTKSNSGLYSEADESFHPEFLQIDSIPQNELLSPDSPDNNLLLDDKKVFIAEAIKYLSDDERFVLQAYLEGKSLEDIGKLMKLTPARVGQIKDHAIQRLKHYSPRTLKLLEVLDINQSLAPI